MAFVNERLSEKERRSFMVPDYKEITPKSWTIDKDTDTILFHYWTSLDKPHEDYFAFVYKGTVNKVVMIKDFVDGFTVRWRKYYDISLSCEAIDELRKAFLVYGIRGNTSVNNCKTKVIVEF